MIEEPEYREYIDENQSDFPFMTDVARRNSILHIGIVGATGVVGQMLLNVLKERSFPIGELHVFASSRSEGLWLETSFGIKPINVLNPRKPPELDIVFMAAGSDVARRWGLRFARRGAIVIDKSSYFRKKKYAPLVVPEVNPQSMKTHRGVIANPNCTTIPVVNALAPLHHAFKLKNFTAVSFQAVSGAGKDGITALENELLDPKVEPSAFPQRIANNVIPWIGDSDGPSSSEELKMISESRRILNLPGLPVRCTSVRVPTLIGHGIAIHARFRHRVNVEEARRVLSEFPGIAVIDNPQDSEYPTPLMSAGRDDTLVGRIRLDRGKTGLAFWVVTDNLRKGAATNAVQIAEALFTKM